MTLSLRPYQIEAIAKLRAAYAAGRRAPLLVAPTGSGKTIVGAYVIQSATARGNRSLFVAPRRELIGQTVRKLAEAGIWDVRVIRGAEDSGRPDAPVIVGSIQTLTMPRWLGRLPQADLVTADEAHHMAAAKWSKLAAAYPHARWLGLSATPERADGKPLGDIFDDLVVAATVRELTELGNLVPCRVFAPPRQLEVAELALDPVAAYHQHGAGELGVVFCVTVEHAERTRDAFLAAGVPAAIVTGTTPSGEREQTLQRWAAGEIRVVANCGVLCLDDKTEILTSSGWVGIDDMTDEHLVANWDRGTVTFEKPLEVVRRARNDDEAMVSLKSNRVDVRVTETHRMLYRTTPGGEFLKCPAIDLVGRAVEIPVSGQSLPLDVEHVDASVHKRGRARAIASNTYNLIKREGYSRSDAMAEAARRVDHRVSLTTRQPQHLGLDECRLIGFWLGDGSVNHLVRGGVEYTLSQSLVYPKIIEWVDGVLGRLGMHNVRRGRSYAVDHVRWSLPRGTGGGSQERIGIRPIEPYLNKDGSALYWGMNEEQFDALIEGFWLADGDHLKGEPLPTIRSMTLHNTNHRMLSLLQAIASVRGYGTHLTSGVSRKEHHQVPWQLRLKKKESFHLGNAKFTKEATWLSERVWCVKTRTKNIVTRRNGSVVVMGNTEGFDLPALSVCILARRFGHAGLFLQCVGRVLRPSPGKTMATVVDLCGSVHEHGTPDMDREYSLTGKAISSVARDAIRQCLSCGACFPLGPQACPVCGTELPRRPAQLPRSTGIGVVDITTMPKPAPRSFVVSITAKYAGICRACNDRIEPGDQIYWVKGEKPRHAECRREAVTA